MWKFSFTGAVAAGVLLVGAGCMAPNAPSSGQASTPAEKANFETAIVPSAAAAPLVPRRFVPLTRIQEYLIVGTDFDGSGHNLTAVDPLDAFMRISIRNAGYPDGTYFPPGVTKPTQAVLASDTVGAGASTLRKAGRSATLDDDYADEAVLVSWDPAAAAAGQLTLCDPDGQGTVTNRLLSADLSVASGDPVGVGYDLAAADLDGDGYDEIAVVGAVADAKHRAGRLWVFDDGVHGFALVGKTDLTGEPDVNLGHLGMTGVKVAAGVLDAGRQAKLVVAWTDSAGDGRAHYRVLDGRTRSVLRSGTAEGLVPADLFNGLNLRLVNLDADACQEILIAGMSAGFWESYSVGLFTTDYTRTWYQYIRLTVLDDLAGGLATLVAPSVAASWNPWVDTWWNSWGNYTPPGYPAQIHYPDNFAVPVGIGLDNIDSVVLGPSVYTVNLSAGTFAKKYDLDLAGGTYNTVVADIAGGDVTGDLRDDVLVLFRTGKAEAWGELDNLVRMGDGSLTMGTPTWNKLDSRGGQAVAYDNAVLVPWNIDADSTLLEYQGTSADPVKKAAAHTTLYKDPKILALLAAPPVRSDLGQNLSSSLTSLGTGTSSSYQAGINFSVRTGVIFGFEAGVSSGLFANVEVMRVEAELELQLEASGSYSQGVTVTKTVTDAAGAGEDQVVFATLPYDRYTYVVASHPVPALVGQTLTIDVPQKPKVLSFPRDYYNSHTPGVKVTTDLLPDTPYHLDSYLKAAQRTAFLAKTTVEVGGGNSVGSSTVLLGSVGPETVAAGTNAFKSQQVDLSKNTTWSAGLQFNLDASAKVIAGGVKVGTSFGYSVGGFYESTSAQNLSFNGTVGGIPAAVYDGNQYDWGLFAYRQTLTDEAGKAMQSFVVVNYWIE